MLTRKLLDRLLLVLILTSLVLSGSVPALGQEPGQASGSKKEIKEWYKQKMKKEKVKKEKRITPADRQAAAERAAAGGFTLEAMLAAAPALPGETPRYFSHPNYANSPLPAVTGHCSVTTATACSAYTDCPAGESCVVDAVSGGIRKFVDGLPGLNAPNNLGQQIPVAVPDITTYPNSDYYEIAVVQFREQMHTDLPGEFGTGTLHRGYVQLTDLRRWNRSTVQRDAGRDIGAHGLLRRDRAPFPGTGDRRHQGQARAPPVPQPAAHGPGGQPVHPHRRDGHGLGHGTFVGRHDRGHGRPGRSHVRPDRSRHRPKAGRLFHREPRHPAPARRHLALDQRRHAAPVDHPRWREAVPRCRGWGKQGRQRGLRARYVVQRARPYDYRLRGQTTCACTGATNYPGEGAQTYYWTNQQSARLMFYHDHAWGITRLNVYAGEAAAYVITDDTEQALVGAGLIPGPADTIPLVDPGQDLRAEPRADRLAGLDLGL